MVNNLLFDQSFQFTNNLFIEILSSDIVTAVTTTATTHSEDSIISNKSLISSALMLKFDIIKVLLIV